MGKTEVMLYVELSAAWWYHLKMTNFVL